MGVKINWLERPRPLDRCPLNRRQSEESFLPAAYRRLQENPFLPGEFRRLF